MPPPRRRRTLQRDTHQRSREPTPYPHAAEPAMYAPDQDTRLSAHLRTMRILVIALAMGILTFLVVAVVVRQQNPNQPVPDPPIITITALGFAGLQLILQAVIPGLVANGLRRQLAAGTWPRPGMGQSVPADDVGKLCMLYQTRLILGAAL